jgi:hypothetical protein
MNASPGSPEIQMILDADFLDAWAEAGQGHRPPIDLIFHTPDLIVRVVTTIKQSCFESLDGGGDD